MMVIVCVGVCVLLVFVRSIMKTIEKKVDVCLLPAFLQISSGRNPEGGLCKKSLWISETHKRAHTQSRSHTHTHTVIVLIYTNTHPQVSPIVYNSICIGTDTNYARQHR